MPCVSLPTVPPATLPSPFSITPPLPALGVSTTLNLCCKELPFQVKTPSIPLPPGAIAVAVPLLKAARTVINAYINAKQVRCPRE